MLVSLLKGLIPSGELRSSVVCYLVLLRVKLSLRVGSHSWNIHSLGRPL